MRAESHPDVEYFVAAARTERVCPSFDEALSYAFAAAVSAGKVTLDIVISSEEGAEFFGGEDAAEEYRDDPETSVFRRFEIVVRDLGRVP